MRLDLALAAVLLALPSATVEAAGLADLAPDVIASMVDVRSFPSSIGPRRQDDLKTFADYGFTEVTLVDGTAELYEEDRSWMFAVTILEASDDRVVLCVLDRALGGPTYNAQKPIAFVPGTDGLLVATDETVDNPACPTFPVNG